MIRTYVIGICSYVWLGLQWGWLETELNSKNLTARAQIIIIIIMVVVVFVVVVTFPQQI